MKVSSAKMVALLVACGLDTAADWDLDKLRKKVSGGVKKYRESGTELPPDLAAFYDEVVATQAAGTVIEIADGDYVPAKTPSANGKPKRKASVKKAVSGKSKPAATSPEKRVNPVVGMSYAEYKAHYAKHPQPLTERGAGVVRTLVELLRTAGSAAQPITKKEMHAVLVELFPSRDPKKMWTTVNNRVPSYLNNIQGMGIVRDRATGGYFIPAVAEPKAKTPSAKGKPKRKAPVEVEPRTRAKAK